MYVAFLSVGDGLLQMIYSKNLEWMLHWDWMKRWDLLTSRARHHCSNWTVSTILNYSSGHRKVPVPFPFNTLRLRCVSFAIPSHFHGVCVVGELLLRLRWF